MKLLFCCILILSLFIVANVLANDQNGISNAHSKNITKILQVWNIARDLSEGTVLGPVRHICDNKWCGHPPGNPICISGWCGDD